MLEREQTRSRYEAMLEKVYAWKPPHDDFIKSKEFMIQQIKQSIEFDCDGYDPIVTKVTGEQFRKDKIRNSKLDIKYYKKRLIDDKARITKQNMLDQLLYNSFE